MINKVLEGALQWAANGVPVFPCDPNDKSPLTANGFLDASMDPATVRKMFSGYGDEVLVGARMGSASGLFAVDFDLYKPNVTEYMNGLVDSGALTTTRVHKTRSGGLHFIYEHDTQWPNVKPHSGVEVKGEGGYIIVPPSRGYEVVDDSYSHFEIASDALLAEFKKARQQASLTSTDTLKAKVLNGEDFHDSLVQIAAKLSGSGMSQERVQSVLFELLEGSVARNSKHERHDRWKHLYENTGGEFARIASSSHAKFNSNSHTEKAREIVGNEFVNKFKSLTSGMFHRPADGTTDPGSAPKPEQPKLIEVPTDGDFDWPFADAGYFSQDERDVLTQKYIMYPLLAERETVLIAAEPKAGKTAIALKLAMAVAAGESLGEGLEVFEPRDVLYFTLEGARAVEMRIIAERMHRKDTDQAAPDKDRLFVVDRPQNFMDPDAQLALCQKIINHNYKCKVTHGSDLGVIFVDTITKGMPGGDQNSVEDTSKFFHFVDVLRTNGITANVVFIHHLSKTGAVRGSTNIEAEVDVVASVEKTGTVGVVSLNLRRARSIDESVRYLFKLSSYYIGTTVQGFKLHAPVVSLHGAEDVTSAGATAKDAAKWKDICVALIANLGYGSHNALLIATVLGDAGLTDFQVKPKTKDTDTALQKMLKRVFTNQIVWVYGKHAFKAVWVNGILVTIEIKDIT